MRTWLTASCTKHQKSSKQHGKVKWKSFLNIFAVLAVVRHQKIKLTYRVLLGFSSNVMYSVPWTSSFKVKSSKNISWCSWQPRRPKWRVSRYHRVQRNDFFRSFSELLYFVPRNFWEPGRHFFLKTKMRTYVVVMVTALFYHRFFSVIPLLRRNTTIINQSNLRNFLA